MLSYYNQNVKLTFIKSCYKLKNKLAVKRGNNKIPMIFQLVSPSSSKVVCVITITELLLPQINTLFGINVFYKELENVLSV